MTSNDFDARSRRAYPEPSLDELLGDPIMDLVLRRDGIDAASVRTFLRHTAQNLYGKDAVARAAAA